MGTYVVGLIARNSAVCGPRLSRPGLAAETYCDEIQNADCRRQLDGPVQDVDVYRAD